MGEGGQEKINRSDKQRKWFIILNELSFSFLKGGDSFPVTAHKSALENFIVTTSNFYFFI